MEPQPFCYKCGTACKVGVNFCPKCGAPVTMLATVGPYETILTEGYGIREAADRPRNLIILIGIIVFWMPQLLIAIFLAVSSAVDFFGNRLFSKLSEYPPFILIVCFSGGWAFLCSRVIAKAVRGYRRLKREAKEEANGNAGNLVSG